jgi:ribosomal protein L37E
VDKLPYDGLNTHTPLEEGPAGDHGLTAEELDAQAEEFKRRRAEYIKEYRAKIIAKSPEAWLAEKREERRHYVQRNPEGAKRAEKKYAQKSVENKRHYCAICDHAFTKPAKLRKHLDGPKHKAKEAQLNGAPPVRHYCDVCGKLFPRSAELRRHRKTDTHKAKKAELDAMKSKLL